MAKKETYPVKRCRLCGRGFTYVRGYSESEQVCGICLAGGKK
jgi:hypothetical protein